MRQSAVVLAAGWSLAPLQFLTAVIVAREVGPDGKGALALLTGLTAILVSVVGFGVPSGAAAAFPRGVHSRGDVVATSIALTTISTCLAVVVYLVTGPGILDFVLSDRDVATLHPRWILLAVVAVVPAALAAVADVVLIAANAMRTYSVRTAAGGLFGVAMTWVLTIQLGWGVAGALVSYPAAACVGLAIFARWWSRERDLWPARISLRAGWSLLHVGVQQHAIALIALVGKRLDVFLIAGMLSVQEAGFYAAGILIPQTIINIPRATMWPLVSALSVGKAVVPDAVQRISRLQVASMIVVSAGLAALAPLVVRALFGEVFGPSVAPFRWSLLGIPLTPVTITVNAILTARTRPGLSIVSSLIGTGVQLALTLLLIPVWGISGSAAALSANFIVTALVQLAIVRSQGVDPAAVAIARPDDIRLLAKALRVRLARDRKG
jgi:O-antigen/teichoic acid export membrane protein